MDNTSEINISKSAYKSNINFLKKVVGDDVMISSVVKGNAYGHGYGQIVSLAEENKINHFSVFSVFEAMEVKKIITKKSSIMIFGFISGDHLEWVINNNIEFYIFDIDGLEKAMAMAKRLNTSARIHLELETGFNRTGIEPEEFDLIIETINNNRENFEVEGLCTHFAGAESISNYLRIKQQLILFKKYLKIFNNRGIVSKKVHAASSSATLLYPDTRFNMVRVGIAQYGFWPTMEVLIARHNKYGNKESDLKRVISWKSVVMSVKKVETGEFVGYGTSFQATKNMKIAIVPVGYNNGYSRNLSNVGHVLIKGKEAKVIGLVTMNTISVDITDIKDAIAMDEVVLIGRQHNKTISVASFSEMSNYLNYQILARLPLNISRIIVN